MTEIITADIHVETKPTRRGLALLLQAGFWMMLVGSVGISRVWFGGSFLIEILATVFSIAMLMKIARRTTGREITMSPAEVGAWLDAGAPKNVKEWRENNKVVPLKERSR